MKYGLQHKTEADGGTRFDPRDATRLQGLNEGTVLIYVEHVERRLRIGHGWVTGAWIGNRKLSEDVIKRGVIPILPL